MKGRSEHRKFFAAISTGLVFFAADRFLKNIAVHCSDLRCGRIFFNFHENRNLAFGFPFDSEWAAVLAGLILVVLTFLFIRARKGGNVFLSVSLFVIILGAASNLMDRILYGYVIDYIDIPFFTVFNLADVLVVAGIGCWLLYLVKKGRQ